MKYFKKQFLENVTFELKQVWHGESPQFILSDKRSLNSTPQSLWNSLLLQILWDSFSLYLNRKAVRERAGGQHNKRQHRADLNPGHFDSKWANCSTWWVKPWPQTRLLLTVCMRKRISTAGGWTVGVQGQSCVLWKGHVRDVLWASRITCKNIGSHFLLWVSFMNSS